MELAEKLQSVEGQLQKLDEQQFSRLDFQWEGIAFLASSSAHDGGGVIKLTASIGRLFYTIEDASARAESIEKIFAINRGIDGAYKIDKKGIVHFECVTLTDTVLTGSDLINALTLILLEGESHLRALRTYLRPIDI